MHTLTRISKSLYNSFVFFGIFLYGRAMQLLVYLLLSVVWVFVPRRRETVEDLLDQVLKASKTLSILRFLNIDSIAFGMILKANEHFRIKKIDKILVVASEIQFLKIYDADLINTLYKDRLLTDSQFEFLKSMGISIALKKAIIQLIGEENRRGA